MKTIEITEHAGADKIVHLAVPVDSANQLYRFVIVVEPAENGTCKTEPPARTWPPGFFEATVGQWVGEFERPPQGEFEKREEL